MGKLSEKEIDFIAIKDGRTVYFKVTDEMLPDATKERELKPLRSIQDSCEKVVVVRQGRYEADVDGIKNLSSKDFFPGSAVLARFLFLRVTV